MTNYAEKTEMKNAEKTATISLDVTAEEARSVSGGLTSRYSIRAFNPQPEPPAMHFMTRMR